MLSSVRSINPYDEGLILAGAQEFAAGAFPHRDFYVNYGPAQFAILAGLFHLFGSTVLTERVWDAAIRAVIVCLVFLLARLKADRVVAAIAAAATFLWLAALGSAYGYALFPALAAVLAAGWLLGRETPATVGAGLGFGVAFLFRYDIGVACLLAAILSFAVQRRRGDVTQVHNLLVGFGAIVIPWLIWMLRAHAAADWWFDIVVFPSDNYARTRSLPFPGLKALFVDPFQVSVFVPFFALAASLPVLHVQRSTDRATWFWFLATAAFCAKGWVRVSPIHLSAAFVSSLVLLSARIEPVWRSAPTGLTLALAAIPLFAALQNVMARMQGNAIWIASESAWTTPSQPGQTGSDTCRPPPFLDRASCFSIDAPTAASLAYVEQNSPGNSRIFVATPRHDRIFANDMAFYFLAGRRPATKFYHDDPGLQTAAPVQQTIIRDLRRLKPALVVVEDIFQNVAEPNDSVLSSGVQDLDRFLRTRFEKVAWFGRFAILAPKKEAAP